MTCMTSYSWGKWISAALSNCLLVPSVQGPDAEAARRAGAEIVGGAELIDKVECLVSVVCVCWVCCGVCAGCSVPGGPGVMCLCTQ